YKIIENIDLEGFDRKGISNFSGTLDGGLCTIRNLKSDKCGLFKRLDSGACVKNIRLEDVEIATTTKTLGGIVSYIPSSAKDITIDNCMVSGILCNLYEGKSKLNFCGAIAGVIASRDCTVTNCSSSATVEAAHREGGIVGLNYGKISNSFFTGMLRCAYNDHDYCKKDMVIDENGEEMYNLLYYVGGVAGGIACVNFGEISSCAVLLQGFDEHIYLGQISGINIKNKGRIGDCFIPKSHELFVAEHYDDIANTLSSSGYSRIQC
ncbi:MAG: hypothetical protein K2G32_09325, partial [Oscillospiraceae bacterium]|nr:hypothetical protein [Oscillospiraceae bacterium]